MSYTPLDIQTLPALLRQEAINHLKTSQEITARSFRKEYSAVGKGTYKSFLDHQKKNYVWGTYIEAIALAEKYKVNLVVTPVTQGIQQPPICLYRTNSTDAKIVHLYNSNNTHWYVDSTTKGDGNCLYNAFAQELIRLAILTPKQSNLNERTSSKSTAVSAVDFTIFHPKHQQTTRTHQKAILSAIMKAPLPAEIEADFHHEKERISKLSLQEQQQIADDHAYALRLART